VLAHSLRDARTTKKLAVLVTLDSVSADVITQLKVWISCDKGIVSGQC
jgi:glycogenin